MHIPAQTTFGLAATLVVALASTPARAGHDDTTDAGRGRYDEARVIDVQPIVRLVRVATPRQECWEEDRYVGARGAPRGTAAGAITGALIGGVVGRQFGSGRGRDAATVAGALIGSAIGTDHAAQDNWHRGEARGHYETRTRCSTRDDWREEERVEGYRVTYEYEGERYVTRTSRDPGASIKVHVSVRPVGY